MAEKFPAMDVTGPKSQLAERWRVWLRNFTFYAEGKANLENPARKRNELLYRAGLGVQDIFENLQVMIAPEDQADHDNVYEQCIRTLNAYFHVEENAAYERHVLRQLKQEPGEDVDSFVLRLRKQARHCGYGPGEIDSAVRDQLLEKIASPELRTKLFEVPNIQLMQALTTARAWETARCQASKIAGVEEVNTVQTGSTETRRKGSGKSDQKCFACGKFGHFARDNTCPARGKTCANCGKRNHWAICCQSKDRRTNQGRPEYTRQAASSGTRGPRVHRAEYDSDDNDEPYAFPVNLAGVGQDNVLTVSVNGTATQILVDSGAQTSVLGERQFNSLVKRGLRVKLQPDSRNVRVYGNGRLPVRGKFNAIIECSTSGRRVEETVLVTEGEGRFLLGSPAAKELGILLVGQQVPNTANVYSVVGDIEDITERFPKVFTGVGKLADYQLSLHVNPEVVPVAQKPRRVPYPLKEKVKRKVDELIALDIIEEVAGPTTWVSPAVFAPKPSKDDVRICVDMRRANEAIQREKLPIPTVDEVLQELNGSAVFSKLDMNMGFHQIELDEGSRDITTFAVGDSLYRYKRLSFGINSAPEKYQHIIRQTIAGCPGAINIADDIVVHGKDIHEHNKNLLTLLTRLQERNLTLNKKKCQIRMDRIEFMGLLLSKHGVGPTEEKVRAVREATAPTNVAELRSFLGLVTFSARFLPDFATSVEPLRKLTRQGTKWQWGSDEEKAFQSLKEQLANASMMAYYKPNAPTRVVADASPVGLGAVLVQEQDGVDRAVCFASRSLSQVERRYSQTEKEALALVWGCERFHLYLSGLPSFELVTDCKALQAIYGPKSKPSARVERWVLRMMPYVFTVKHVPSSHNIADCLSRLTKIPASIHHGQATDEVVRAVALAATPQAMTTREIERASAHDEELTQVRQCWKTDNWSTAPSCYRLVRDEITVIGKLVLRGTRIIVPAALRERILDLAHEGHQGVVKTKERIRTKVWWPGISTMVERRCKTCIGCQAATPTFTSPTVKTTVMPTKPWRYLALDLMGPLPRGESLLVTVDYFSRWIEVDVVKSTTSNTIIGCLEKHFSRHGVPEVLRTDNAPNLISSEVKAFLDELGVHHTKTIPLWPRANGEVERQNRSLLKSMRVAQIEGKPWRRELQKFLLAYRSTPHTTTGASPAELLFGRKMRTKLPSFEGSDGAQEGPPQLQDVFDRDAEQKQNMADRANKRTTDSDLQEGQQVLLMSRRQNKLSPVYDPKPYTVISRKGDLLVIERGDVLLKRNVAHVKRFFVAPDPLPLEVPPAPNSPGQMVPLPQSDTQVNLNPELKDQLSPAETPMPCSSEPQFNSEEELPRDGLELRRSTRVTKQPGWLKDFVK